MARSHRIRSAEEHHNLRRFPIAESLAYKCVRGKKVSAAGQGKTLEISSGAVTFTTEHALRLRQRVEISLDWPAMLDSTCLKLVINGRVLRADADSATVAIEHYEFRTRAVRPGQSTAQASAAGAD